MMFLLQCPKCKNRMRYQSKGIILSGKRKQCVYCGHSYKIKDCVVERLT